MFVGELLISRVQKIHFRSLQVVYNTYDTTYGELLSMDNDVSIHKRLLKPLNQQTTQIYIYAGLF